MPNSDDVSPADRRRPRIALVVTLSVLGGVLIAAALGVGAWALMRDRGPTAPPVAQETTAPRATVPSAPAAKRRTEPVEPPAAAPTPVPAPAAEPVPAPAPAPVPAAVAAITCPTGSMTAVMGDVPTRVDGIYTYFAPTGTLTNNYTAPIEIAETFTPSINAVDANGRVVWAFNNGGGYDVAVTPGQARPATVVVQPGQSIEFGYPERDIAADTSTIVGWVTEAQSGKLMPFWVPNSLTRTCGTVGGWH